MKLNMKIGLAFICCGIVFLMLMLKYKIGEGYFNIFLNTGSVLILIGNTIALASEIFTLDFWKGEKGGEENGKDS